MKVTSNKNGWLCDECVFTSPQKSFGVLVLNANELPISLCHKHARQLARGIERVLAKSARKAVGR